MSGDASASAACRIVAMVLLASMTFEFGAEAALMSVGTSPLWRELPLVVLLGGAGWLLWRHAEVVGPLMLRGAGGEAEAAEARDHAAARSQTISEAARRITGLVLLMFAALTLVDLLWSGRVVIGRDDYVVSPFLAASPVRQALLQLGLGLWLALDWRGMRNLPAALAQGARWLRSAGVRRVEPSPGYNDEKPRGEG